MEAWQIPLISGALSFLYDVGKELLIEIRSRREVTSTQDNGTSLDKVIYDLTLVPKDVALKATVDAAAFENKTEALESLVRLSNIYTKNYTAAKEKAAMWGPGLVPPIINHEIEDAENNLTDISEKLHRLVKETLRTV